MKRNFAPQIYRTCECSRFMKSADYASANPFQYCMKRGASCFQLGPAQSTGSQGTRWRRLHPAFNCPCPRDWSCRWVQRGVAFLGERDRGERQKFDSGKPVLQAIHHGRTPDNPDDTCSLQLPDAGQCRNFMIKTRKKIPGTSRAFCVGPRSCRALGASLFLRGGLGMVRGIGLVRRAFGVTLVQGHAHIGEH